MIWQLRCNLIILSSRTHYSLFITLLSLQICCHCALRTADYAFPLGRSHQGRSSKGRAGMVPDSSKFVGKWVFWKCVCEVESRKSSLHLTNADLPPTSPEKRAASIGWTVPVWCSLCWASCLYFCPTDQPTIERRKQEDKQSKDAKQIIPGQKISGWLKWFDKINNNDPLLHTILSPWIFLLALKTKIQLSDWF